MVLISEAVEEASYTFVRSSNQCYSGIQIMCSQISNLRRGREVKNGSLGSSSRVMMSLSSSIENESSVHTGSTSSHDDAVRDAGEDIDMYTQMWQACAGVLAYVPRVGESVFYFPQGHIEQVEPYFNRDSEMEMPIYNLPSEILCKVLNVQLKVETDEVFAQITLLPISKRDEAGFNFENTSSPRAPRNKPQFNAKILSSSDTRMNGGLTLPKRLADECLPPLDMSQQPPSQEVIMKDLRGFPWPFRHIYRGRPMRHLLTTGWSAFVNSKKLVVGDACIFLRGRNGDLRIGVRHSAKSRNNLSPPVISSHTMRHGILASAFHRSMFTVYYRPWTCPSCFIVPLDRYVESETKDYSVGKKFKMQFEDNAFREQRYGGTITGVEDIDHVRWPGSKWRSIKVRWNSVQDEHSLPERISPWEVELAVSNKQKQSFPLTPPKRICIDNSSRDRPPVIADGCRRAGVEALPNSKQGVFQGQKAMNNLFRDIGAADLQISLAKSTSQDSSNRPPANPGKHIPRTDPGLDVDNLLVLGVGQMKLECHEGEDPRAEDDGNNDAPPSHRKEIKVFGFKLGETPQELPSQLAAGRGE